MKYKTDFKKYWKSEVDKYKSISVEIKRSERADFVDSKFRYMITIIIIPQNNLIRHQVVIQNEEACVLTKEDMLSIFSNLVNILSPRAFRKYTTPMLKIYIYWHKCYFGHGDEQQRTTG